MKLTYTWPQKYWYVSYGTPIANNHFKRTLFQISMYIVLTLYEFIKLTLGKYEIDDNLI